MALINKIREHSGMAVGVVAIALLLFIVGGDIFQSALNGGGIFGRGDQNKVGEIAGTSVDYKEFLAQVDAARANYESQTGRAANEQELQQIRNQAWEQFVFDIAYKKEFDALGLKVTPDELREMIQGTKNLHPMVKQQFTDPQTGQYNRDRHLEFINMAANNQLPAQQKAAWDNFKSQLMKVRLQEKYEALLRSSAYVTNAEAKKSYVTQTEKVDARYVFVPFYSINDSTVKVTDSQLEDYLSKHKKEYKGYDSRTFEYAVFQVAPTKEDSAALYNDIKLLAKGLASAPNPQDYASQNSDTRLPYLRSASEIPADVKAILSTTVPGAVIGPFKDGNSYAIYKYEGTATDTNYTARASHILIRADKTAPDSVKAQARKTAQDVLNQLKGGADFATLASTYGSDGTKQTGGDLGYFKNNGQMVKPFEQAVFGFGGTGLLPNLVETDFGYHIVKVTDAKSNVKYKLATVTRELDASEATRNQIYQKAESLRASCDTREEFEAAVKKDGKLVLLTAEKVTPEASAFNTIQNARDIVLWAFNDDTKMDGVSNRVFEEGNNFIIAALKGKTEKDNPKAADFKDALTLKVRNELKAEQIMKKLSGASGTLEQIAQKYGAGALVETVTDINLYTGMLNSAGLDAVALGKAFGQAAGKRTKPFVGDNGAFIMETTKVTKAPEIADYGMYKQQIAQRTGGYAVSGLANQAIRENANIKDNRAKFF